MGWSAICILHVTKLSAVTAFWLSRSSEYVQVTVGINNGYVKYTLTLRRIADCLLIQIKITCHIIFKNSI